MKEDLMKLGREELVDITIAILEGKTYEEARESLISSKERGVIDSLHTLMCKGEHLSEPSAASCGYYLEGDDFLKERHWVWVGIYRDITKSFNISLDEFVCTLEEVIGARRQLFLNSRASIPLFRYLIEDSLR